jgi:hypothetical protein
LKKALIVPGFLKNQKDVEISEQIVTELQPQFNEKDWVLQLSSSCYGGKPSYAPLIVYGRELYKEIKKSQPDALMGHSMGVDVIRYALYYLHGLDFKGPKVFIEGPNYGSPKWKLIVTGFPMKRSCVQDMVWNSEFMQMLSQADEPTEDASVLEIQGKRSEWWLSREIFKKLPYSRVKVFHGVDHVDLVTHPAVIETVLRFLNSPNHEVI